jgi:hypothetical protein
MDVRINHYAGGFRGIPAPLRPRRRRQLTDRAPADSRLGQYSTRTYGAEPVADLSSRAPAPSMTWACCGVGDGQAQRGSRPRGRRLAPGGDARPGRGPPGGAPGAAAGSTRAWLPAPWHWTQGLPAPGLWADTFPRRRLVKFCTKRFRGNAADIGVSATTPVRRSTHGMSEHSSCGGDV